MVLLPSLIQADSTAAIAGEVTSVFGRLAATSLLVIASLLAVLFVISARREPPRIENHWGGFGGSGGGWRMSASMAYLIAALAFGAMFTSLAKDMFRPPENPGGKESASTKVAASKSDSASKTGGVNTDSTAKAAASTAASHDSTIARPAAP